MKIMLCTTVSYTYVVYQDPIIIVVWETIFLLNKKRYKAPELPMLSLNTMNAVTEHLGAFYGPSDMI